MTREEAEKTCVLWSCDDAEDGLQAASPDEAIEDFLEDYYNHALGPVVVFPPTLTLQGYVRMKPKARTLASRPGSNFGPVAGLLDALDEEYGDPDGNETKPTASMMEAERVFIEAVLTEYTVWQCEGVYTEEVDATAWLAEHRPQWLDPDRNDHEPPVPKAG